jgi:hypothetical protein
MRRRLTIIAGMFTGAIACMLVFAAMASALTLGSCRDGLRGVPGDRDISNEWSFLAAHGWMPADWRWGYYNQRSGREWRQDVEFLVWVGAWRWYGRAMYICHDGDGNGTTGSNDDYFWSWQDHPAWHIG